MESLSIPKDALVPIKVGTSFLLRLQQAMLFMLKDRTKEELKELESFISIDKVPESTWQYTYCTIGLLVTAIEQQAIKDGIAKSTPVGDSQKSQSQ